MLYESVSTFLIPRDPSLQRSASLGNQLHGLLSILSPMVLKATQAARQAAGRAWLPYTLQRGELGIS